ncbi:uncharacterized protein LOC143301465 [Babylonia areolata]|uniref:uncharacterized protein LOC143301465 n=1 Tax=Babylonia areolata TaxID=304850 RepID=UPI003FD10713
MQSENSESVYTRAGQKREIPEQASDASQRKQICASIADRGQLEGHQSEVSTQTDTEERIPPSATDQGCQWTDFSLEDHDYCKTVKPTASKTFRDASVLCRLSKEETVAEKMLKTDSDARLYCGVPLNTFWTLVDGVQQFAHKKWRMPVSEQILMTLMKLKLNLLLADLARRFGVSESLVSKTISFWIDALETHLSSIVVWLPRESIRHRMPDCFKKHFPKTTCILDCAETIMQKPSNLKSGRSYSNYKSHNTVKYCVAVAPCGIIMHISKAYGGKASDKYIVSDSGILQNLLPGDEVMADRGFTIEELLFPLGVNLNIPAFSQGKQLSDEEVTRKRRLANAHIHVERAIMRLKVFKILEDPLPISLAQKIDKILCICAALVNLGFDLIQEKQMEDQ